MGSKEVLLLESSSSIDGIATSNYNCRFNFFKVITDTYYAGGASKRETSKPPSGEDIHPAQMVPSWSLDLLFQCSALCYSDDPAYCIYVPTF